MLTPNFSSLGVFAVGTDTQGREKEEEKKKQRGKKEEELITHPDLNFKTILSRKQLYECFSVIYSIIPLQQPYL